MPDPIIGTIVVTGGSRGIGASISTELARVGFRVACLSRSGDMPDATGLEESEARRLLAMRCDVTDAESVRQAFAEIEKSSEHSIVGLVNNAGVHLQGHSATFPIADFQRVMTANATSVLLMSQAAYPYLRESGSALIVNIGSFYDKLGVKGNAAYCASKAAVGAISRCLAVEWARDGINVLNIAPGYIETDLNREDLNEGPLQAFLKKRIPTGGPGHASDIGRFVAMLFQLPARFMTGETLYVDGGQGVAL
ncbi:SDR family NAD(P)-dependent oxidoreductase [Trinickia sp. EG282A]|uniref:SDR family NAD(P)-dependent oxidoreductase n=1 Tax=Trinickia sp. EG282A TaxID=3237013 RepID=UPI0034D349F2